MYPISSHDRRRGRWHARLAASAAAVALALSAGAARAETAGRNMPAQPSCVCRGQVISVDPVASFSAAKLAAGLKSIGLGSWSPLVHYGVDGYRVTYRTIAVTGSPTIASGLIVLPRRSARTLRTVEFDHGTDVLRRGAPSFNPQSDGQLTGLVAASAGFAAVAPDYLGLGAAPQSATFYLPYVLLAWNRIYHLYQRPAQAFRPPYDHTMPVLYDGYHTDAQIQAGLAPTVRALLTPRFLRLLHHPTAGLLRGMRINDATCDWHPNVPVRLYAARGDRDSVIANAWHCQAALAAHGAHVPVIDVGPVAHNPSLERSFPPLLTWFQHLS